MESLIKRISIFSVDRESRRIPFKYSRGFHALLLSVLTLVLISIFVYIDRLAASAEYDSLYRNISDDLDLVRARLEGNINSSLQTAQGLMAAISVEPDMDQERFAEFARPLFESVHALRNIGAAPDLTIRLIYPLVGNEDAIGLNLAANNEQREAALRAMKVGEMIVAGPVNLAQGGTGFIGRIPVFVTRDGERQFWGLISAVIEVDRLYDMSGVFGLLDDYAVAIRGLDGKGEDGEIFFGDANIFNKQAVMHDVTLPGGGSWQIAVVPKRGWPTAATRAWQGRFFALAFVIIVVGWAYIFMRMLRQQYEKDIRLNDLFFRSPLGLALNDYTSGRFIDVNPALAEMTGYSVEEFKQLTFYDITPDDHFETDALQLKNLNNAGSFGPYEKDHLHKDGHRIPVLIHGTMVKDMNGSLLVWSIVEDITQQKKTQQTMAQLRNELQRFFDLSVNIMAIRDKGGRFETVNKACEIILGYSREELLKMDLFDIVHPDDMEATVTAKKNLVEGKIGSQKITYRLRSKSGRYVNLLWSSSIDPHSGKIYSSAIDVTDQVRAEQKLRQQTELLEQIGSQAIIGAWEVDFETKQVYWSPVIKKIHGVDDNFEPTLDSHKDFVAGQGYLHQFENAMRRCVKDKQPFKIEYEILTPKKNHIWVTLQGQGEYQANRCVRVFGYMQDISDRKLSQEKLLSAHTELEQQMSLVETIAYAQSNFISCAELTSPFDILLRDILRLTKSDYGFIAEIFYHNDGPPYIKTHVLVDPSADIDGEGIEDAAAGSPVFANIKHLLDAAVVNLEPMVANNLNFSASMHEVESESLTMINYLGVPITSDGKGIGFIGLANKTGGYDISMVTWLQPLITTIGQIISSVRAVRARDAMQAQLIEAKQVAEQAANTKSEFLATMSHEIRTPLNGVIGMISLLKHSVLDDQQKRQISIAKTSAEALLALINDILDFSKIEAGKLELETVEFNLQVLLGSFVETMALRAQEKNVELILDFHQLDTPSVKGDPARLLQIFSNLVGNAIKFTPKGEVVVACSSFDLGSQVKLIATVKDTGIGISEDKIEQLFQPFTQADSSTTRNFGGTGLGLAICKNLCTSMHGKIKVDSELGRGSSFEFEVLLEKSNKPQHKVPYDLLKSRRVLAIDGSRTGRSVLRRQLEEWGAIVEPAENIENALQILGNDKIASVANSAVSKFDLILIDRHLCHQDNNDFLDAIKNYSNSFGSKLVLMSGMDFKDKAEDLGFDFYFPKPITIFDLLNAVAPLSDEIARKVQDYKDLLSVCEDASTASTYTLTMPNSLTSLHWPADTHILLVEDNAVNVEVALMMLNDLGLTTDVVNNGVEALKILKSSVTQQRYSLILMDCQMPEMDGYETTRRIRSGEAGDGYANIPIVAMTANAFESDREKCLAAGMNDYLAKPVDENRLEAKLRKWTALAGVSEQPDTSDDSVKPPSTMEGVDALEKNKKTEKENGDEVNRESGNEWDIESALKLVKGRADRLGVLLQLFCDSAHDRFEMLNNAVDRENFDEVRLAAHSVKGSAGQFCVKSLQQCAADLEKAAKNQDLTAIKLLQPKFNSLFNKATDRFRHYLKSPPQP